MGKPGRWGALALTLVLVAPGPARAGPELEAAKALVQGRTALEALSRLLGTRKATNDDLLDALEAVTTAYETLHDLMHPAPVGGVTSAPGGRLAEDAEGFFDDAEKQFVKAFTLDRVHRTPDYNIREPVNIKAVEALGATGRNGASRAVVRALEGSIFKRKSTVSAELLSRSFEALAALGHLESLEWMIREFTHSKTSPRREVDRLVAAHGAMVLFELDRVPGRVRFDLVQRMIRTYVAVERTHVQSGEMLLGDFWLRVGPGAIEAVQVFAGRPTREAVGAPARRRVGEPVVARRVPINTMVALNEWFRDNRNPNAAPWTDEAGG